MPKTYVRKSIIIDAPVEKVFPFVSDFNNWTAWSPWNILEKEAVVNVKEGGKYFNWDGKRIGAGEMSITEEHENSRINADLTFLRPWKSKAKIIYSFNQKDNSTEVVWEMHSSLPFFMFWMKQMMQIWIGMDFDRGLKMLKELVEKGKVDCQLELQKNGQSDAIKYIGITGNVPIANMGLDMSEKIPQLHNFIRENKLEGSGEVISIYHKWDMKNQQTTYTIAAAVKALPDSLSGSNIKTGEIPATKVNKIIHTGNYEHLGNAWSMQMMMQRNKEFKQNKKIDPFEIYKNSPYDTANEDLVTEVMFPVV